MTHILGHDRSQTLLLPEAVDDYVGADNLVRFIDAFDDVITVTLYSFAKSAESIGGSHGTRGPVLTSATAGHAFRSAAPMPSEIMNKEKNKLSP